MRVPCRVSARLNMRLTTTRSPSITACCATVVPCVCCQSGSAAPGPFCADSEWRLGRPPTPTCHWAVAGAASEAAARATARFSAGRTRRLRRDMTAPGSTSPSAANVPQLLELPTGLVVERLRLGRRRGRTVLLDLRPVVRAQGLELPHELGRR